MSTFWAERSLELERMDVETLDAEATTRILGALETINAWIGGVNATLYHVRHFSRNWEPCERIRFIDWGTGGADIPRALVRWGRAHGFQFEVTGVDSSQTTLDYARRACRDYPEITLVHQDFIEANPSPNLLPFSKGGGDTPELPPLKKGGWGGFDYALSSLTLHHLTDSQIVALLQQSDALCRRGIIMNDLKRSARAWLWIWALTRLSGAHPVVQNDGPLSVLRAFRSEELKTLATRAGLTYLKIKTHFGYRLTLAGEKSPHPPFSKGEIRNENVSAVLKQSPPLKKGAGGICIIGAGPAGNAAAIRLAQSGMKVRLYEKARFPRRKLCGGFLSPECLQDLEQLGVLDAIYAAGAVSLHRTVVSSPWAGSTEAPLPSPGLSLSREALDLILLNRARDVGVTVHEGIDGFNAESEEGWTIVAMGRKAEPGGDYGVQAFFENMNGISDQVELDLFPGGYVGLVRQDRGLTNLCALVTQAVMRQSGPNLDAALYSWMKHNPLLREHLRGARRVSSWQAVGPVQMGLRQLTGDRALFTGDAACVVDPFMGEGITMSLRSAALIARAFQENPDSPAAAYERAWHEEFDRALRWGGWLRRIMQNSLTQNLCVAGLQMFPSRLSWLTERTRTKLYAN